MCKITIIMLVTFLKSTVVFYLQPSAPLPRPKTNKRWSPLIPLKQVNNNFFTHQWSLDKDDSTPLNQPVIPQQLAGIVVCHSRSDDFVKSCFRQVDHRGPASIAAQTSTIDDAGQLVPEALELADLHRARLVADVCTRQSDRTAKTLYHGTYEIVIRNADANFTWNKRKCKG